MITGPRQITRQTPVITRSHDRRPSPDSAGHVPAEVHAALCKASAEEIAARLEEQRLPEADILIHCGDYQIDAGARPRATANLAFDKWFSSQPSASGVRLICRGNHDQVSLSEVEGKTFPASGATYAVRPTVIKACGLTIGVIPFSRGRLREPIPDCDARASAPRT